VTERDGSGVNAALEGYTVCGKTGTAQKVAKTGGYARGRYVSSFMGFTPMHDPALTILVSLDEPRGKYYGGTVSAPAFREIAQQSLSYLSVPPELPGLPAHAPRPVSVDATPAEKRNAGQG